MTQVPVSPNTVQLFAYARLEDDLLRLVKEPGNRRTVRQICQARAGAGLIMNKRTHELESLLLSANQLQFWERVLYPAAHGTLFHIDKNYLENITSEEYKLFNLKTLPSENMIVPEGKVQVQLEPAEYPIYEKFWLGNRKEAAKNFKVPASVMDEICRALLEVPPTDPFKYRAGWPKHFRIGDGKTVILDYVTGNRICDPNNFWKASPTDLILEKATKVLELREEAIQKNPNYILVMRDKNGNLTNYIHTTSGKLKWSITN